MRVRDDKKQVALYRATIKLVNEIGFEASSVSKIAREAEVSPATLYIYFKNKQDLIISTYIDIKKNMSQAILDDLDETKPVRDVLQQVWRNMFTYVSTNKEDFRFTEQFSNSPYHASVNKQELEKHFEPIVRVIKRGIEHKIIKDVSFTMLTAFMFHPIMVLANPNLCSDFELNNESIEASFQLAWDAIRL